MHQIKIVIVDPNMSRAADLRRKLEEARHSVTVFGQTEATFLNPALTTLRPPCSLLIFTWDGNNYTREQIEKIRDTFPKLPIIVLYEGISDEQHKQIIGIPTPIACINQDQAYANFLRSLTMNMDILLKQVARTQTVAKI